ncbi:C39 family peptidase [Vallitalea okinawensis]|uniref:C39 family peptidase n=1 Tax=Vallitalea okinawensis TaxID=2078660 RepID=UPI000CFB1F46|nr:C39 family peptidase [Vallitalea okinawensis]
MIYNKYAYIDYNNILSFLKKDNVIHTSRNNVCVFSRHGALGGGIIYIVQINLSKKRVLLSQISLLIILCLLTFIQLKYINFLKTNNTPQPVHEVLDVPLIPQLPNLPTGCEATSTAMLLQWADLDVSKEEVALLLPKSKIPHRHNGQLYAANPNTSFIGDPYSVEGYGVFHQPITDLINFYLPGLAVDMTGCTFEDLLAVIDSGRPIIVWTTIGMKQPRISKTWYDPNGNEVQWKTPQHSVLLMGYTSSHVIFHDPWTGKKEYCKSSSFKKIWVEMGRQAVTLTHNQYKYDNENKATNN